MLLTLVLGLMPGYQGAAMTNTTEEDTDSLEKLFSDYQQWRLTAYPEWATAQDIPGYDHLVEDFSMEAIRAKADTCRQFLDRSRNLEADNILTQSYQNYFEVNSQFFLLCDYDFSLFVRNSRLRFNPVSRVSSTRATCCLP